MTPELAATIALLDPEDREAFDERAAKIEVEAQQARIDALMLEYCPQEMTPQQIKNYEHNQKAVPNVKLRGSEAVPLECEVSRRE